jgi:hypothetical protein
LTWRSRSRWVVTAWLISRWSAQPDLFGGVASDPTVSRLIDTLAGDAEAAVSAIRAARALARATVWSHRHPMPGSTDRVVVDLDATFGDAMLALADRLFDDFDDLPVITVIRAINSSRTDLGGDPVEVVAVEAGARRRLRDTRHHQHQLGWRIGAWLGTVAVAVTTLLSNQAMNPVAV